MTTAQVGFPHKLLRQGGCKDSASQARLPNRGSSPRTVGHGATVAKRCPISYRKPPTTECWLGPSFRSVKHRCRNTCGEDYPGRAGRSSWNEWRWICRIGNQTGERATNSHTDGRPSFSRLTKSPTWKPANSSPQLPATFGRVRRDEIAVAPDGEPILESITPAAETGPLPVISKLQTVFEPTPTGSRIGISIRAAVGWIRTLRQRSGSPDEKNPDFSSSGKPGHLCPSGPVGEEGSSRKPWHGDRPVEGKCGSIVAPKNQPAGILKST